MLKKLILIIFSIFFIACSNTMTVVDSDQKEEIIKQAISTPKKDVILLGNNYDYLFTGEEARKLLTLIDFLNIKGLTKENIGRIRKNITVNEDGDVKLWISTEFVISKKNNTNDKNFERNQEIFVNDLKKKMEEKNIEYEIEENNMDWRFQLPNAINVNGKVAKLENRDKILQETSKQLINLNIDLIEIHHKEVPKYSKTQIVVGTIGAVLFPVLIPIIIFSDLN